MEIRVPAAAVSSNSLVELGTCPLHDRPGVRTSKKSFYTATPVWTLLLALIALLIALIVMLAIRKEVKGQVVECDECVAGQKRFRYTAISAWVLSFGLLFAAGVSDVFIMLWLLGMIGALVYSFAGNRSKLTGVLSKDQMWVELKKVEPSFAAKVQQRMAAASG